MRKSLYKFEGFISSLQNKDDIVRDINDILSDIDVDKRFGSNRYHWNWVETIDNLDFYFRVSLDGSVVSISALTENDEDIVSYYRVYTSSYKKSSVLNYVKKLRVDCKNLIITKRLFEEWSKEDIIDLCQDLVDLVDLDFTLDKDKLLGWILVVPDKSLPYRPFRIDVFVDELKMLERRVKSIGLSVYFEDFDKFDHELDRWVKKMRIIINYRR